MLYSEVLSTSRRYSRSINLERDLQDAAALDGYQLTPRGRETLELILSRYEDTSAVRAFTITAVYGAGKSSFVHFLLSLLAPARSALAAKATGILSASPDTTGLQKQHTRIATQPAFLRAVAVSRGESIGVTLAQALLNGLEEFQTQESAGWRRRIRSWQRSRGPAELLLEIVQEVATRRPVIIVIDELGKSLEQSATGHNDVYLLQLLAELPRGKYPVYALGLLHASFADYGGRLGEREKAEWQKVQGRFEDISFLDTVEATLALIASALQHHGAALAAMKKAMAPWEKWVPGVPAGVFPLHPLAARALPHLCAKYAQNERSLFHFLTGAEPHAFHDFLRHTPLESHEPTLFRICDLYDYFIEAATLAGGERAARLIELRDRVHQYADQSLPHIEVLRTIAVFNALSVAGFKCSRDTILNALAHHPDNLRPEHADALDDLTKRRILTYRQSVDEYRLWMGSEVDVESCIRKEEAKVPANLAEALNTRFRIRSVVASRHSAESGTMRYFPVLFRDQGTTGREIPRGDGYVLVDISGKAAAPAADLFSEIPEDLPLIILRSGKTHALRTVAREYLALENLHSGRSGSYLDPVAKREIAERYYQMRERLQEMLQRDFQGDAPGLKRTTQPVIEGNFRTLNQMASALCDKVYHAGFRLNNELLNRQKISTQMARAQGQVIDSWLRYRDSAGGHLTGHGPEVSIFRVLTEKQYEKGLRPARKAIEDFITKATSLRPVQELFDKLGRPPFGIRAGVIPLLFVQKLLEKEDSASLYHDGSFVPQISRETLEILVRHPGKFSVKYFMLQGLQAEYFTALSQTYGSGSGRSKVLTVIRPLIKLARELPAYTRQTTSISEPARRLRLALEEARDPDELVFRNIPEALGLPLHPEQSSEDIHRLTRALQRALLELQECYPRLLAQCADSIRIALKLPGIASASRSLADADVPGLRRYLSGIAGLITGSVVKPQLRRFLLAASATGGSDEAWLESIIMVVADKPARNWRDTDRETFAANLAEIAPAFLNLHHLIARIRSAGDSAFTARLISITNPDGEEIRDVIWTDQSDSQKVDKIQNQIREILEQNGSVSGKLSRAVLAELLQEAMKTDTKKSEVPPQKHEVTSKGRRSSGGSKHG